MASLLWLQAGACSGNTISLLQAEEPTVVDLLTDFGVELIWHPSLGPELGEAVQAILADLVSERKPLDIFVLEGTVITGPNGSGRMDMFAGRPMIEWITELTGVASIVVLGLVCTALAFVVFFGLIAEIGPNRAQRITRRVAFLAMGHGVDEIIAAVPGVVATRMQRVDQKVRGIEGHLHEARIGRDRPAARNFGQRRIDLETQHRLQVDRVGRLRGQSRVRARIGAPPFELHHVVEAVKGVQRTGVDVARGERRDCMRRPVPHGEGPPSFT